METVLMIAYWIFVIVSIAAGVYFFVVSMNVCMNSSEQKDVIEAIYLFLGVGEALFAFWDGSKIYPLTLGILYWLIYIIVFKNIWRYFYFKKDDGYKILKKGHLQYNEKLYELDRVCPKCSSKCEEDEEINCGNKTHYLFECEECGTVWTGHFFK